MQNTEINPTLVKIDPNLSLPSSEDAEQSVIAAMLMSPDVFQEALLEIGREDFYSPRNALIFDAMRALFDSGEPVDPVTLSDRLKSDGNLERAGGYQYLIDLAGSAISMMGWRSHVDIIRRQTVLRDMITASAQIQALAYDSPEDTKSVIDQAERLLLSVTDKGIRSSYSHVSEVMEALYLDLSQPQETAEGVMTGFPGLDSRTIGLRAGQMVVFGARPGVGKTSLCLNLAANVAERGVTVALFSLEMSKEEVGQRLLSARSRVRLTDIRSLSIADDQWPSILEASNEISALDILIDDTPGTTVTEIRAKARRMLHGKERGLVIIDYLQLLSSAGARGESRATIVGEMSRGIKIMAKDLGVPVIALSQLNREVEGRVGKRPQLSDLRESGSIEQDADIVILLDRSMTPEEAERADRPDEGVTQLIIAKNRSGPLGTVDMRFDGATTKFYEIDPAHEIEVVR